MGAKLDEVEVVVMADENPDPSYLDQEGFEDRKKEFERGDFGFVGVRAEASVVVGGVIQHITSGGLWGIESDSDKKYIREVGEEEYNALKDILKDMGVKAIPSYKNVKVKYTV
jgi:hypothetical protein